MGVMRVVVGPNYNNCSPKEGDQMLLSAYTKALEVADTINVADGESISVGFSLLSAGIFRGRQSLKHGTHSDLMA